MKHLKQFNESKKDNIIQNIEDILQELKDDDFSINFDYNQDQERITINIIKYDILTNNEIYLNVREYLLSLIDYIKYNIPNGKLLFYIGGSKGLVEFDKYEDAIKNKKLDYYNRIIMIIFI